MQIATLCYPHRSLSELKLENKYQAYYATKMALWAYLLPNWDINNMKVNPNLTGVELERANKMLAAVKDIYRRGTVWSTVLSPNVTVEADQETAYPATINGQEYLQQIFTVTSETWVCNYAVNVAFSDPSAVPAGTKIVDMDNKEIDVITTKATGKGYAGQFKVLYPASAVDGQSGSVQLSFRTNVYKYAIYYAVCAEKDKYGNLQNYMCDTDPTTPLALTAYSNYTDTPEEEPTETSMKILKYEEGTTIPLKGAMFEVVDPEGASVGTFATNSKGQIVIPLTLAGNYTVYEREAPNGYLLSEEPAQNVKVEYGKQAMTEIELNEKIENLLTESAPVQSSRRTGSAYRREMRIRKNDALMRIVTRRYVPHAGYIDYGFDGDTLLHSGKYIKYPKNSNCQRWMKRETSRKSRNCQDLPRKGNYYRRLFDYWWTLY